MNWVNSSLQLAGNLLESVDQHAAITLSGTAEDEDEGLLSSIKQRISKSTVPEDKNEDEEKEDDNISRGSIHEEVLNGKTPSTTIPLPSSASTTDGTSVESISKSTPPHSGSGTRLSSFVSAIATPPNSNSALSEQDPSRLRKEVARLKADIRTKEKLLAKTQKNLQVCEEEIEALESECKEKIAQARLEMIQLQQDKDTNEQNFVQALELKDTHIRTLKEELDALELTKIQHTAEIAKLKEAVANAVESKENIWTSAASASNESEQLIQSLRAELQETLTTMNNLKREYGDSKMAMFVRQSQLEKTNTELVTNIANLERELSKSKELLAAVHTSPGNATTHGNSSGLAVNGFGGQPSSRNSALSSIQEDYRRVQQTLVLTKKALHDESRKNEIQKQEVLTLTDEVQHLKQALETTHKTASIQLAASNQEKDELKTKLSQLLANTNATAAAESESRIQMLTNRLIEKQETVDALRTKITTLEVRLLDAQTRAESAQERLAQIERNGGIDDMEMATPVGKQSAIGIRSRPNRMANMISRVAPVVERSSRVVTALDVLDRWLLFLGRVFLSYPFARLGLMCYIALIHFWVFVILSFHTSHLNEEVQHTGDDAGANTVPHGVFPMEPGVLP